MQLPYDQEILNLNLFETTDKQSGAKRILYGAAFSQSSWSWQTAGIKKEPEGSGRFITIETSSFGYYSLVTAIQGCDGIDLSNSVLDACGICGGDNSTCSGCDGVPNTGRSRNCSGHGFCVSGLCSCNTSWFGVMCDILCRYNYHLIMCVHIMLQCGLFAERRSNALVMDFVWERLVHVTQAMQAVIFHILDHSVTRS